MAQVEVFILNFNGARFLSSCLESLFKLTLGSHLLGINVVDNGSVDGSRELVERDFPKAMFLALDENYGFSGGNNRGVRAKANWRETNGHAPADYYVFLNNDTAVDRDWLVNAVAELDANPKVGVVGSKSLFYDRFAILEFEVDQTFTPADNGGSDTRELAVFMRGSEPQFNVAVDPARAKFLRAYPREGDGRWLSQRGQWFVPVVNPDEPIRVSCSLENHRPDRRPLNVSVREVVSNAVLGRTTIVTGAPESFQFEIAPSSFTSVIQNAGSFINERWEGGDRGFLEVDEGQFDAPDDVHAICGVSMFIRAELFSRIGGFDERYFAYYEDTDLSLQVRRRGFTCRYVPTSRLRHVHCGSGVEFSDYFCTNVAYSQLLFRSKLMDGRAWRQTLTDYRRRARVEFESFEQDYNLVGKPHLRSYCRYLKQYPIFVKNRLESFRVDRNALLGVTNGKPQ